MYRRLIPSTIFNRYTIDGAAGTCYDNERKRFVKAGKSEYLNIYFEGYSYALHRVIFFHETGRQPPLVDHKDRNTKNNKFENLRDFDTDSFSENAKNQAKRRCYFKSSTITKTRESGSS